jgi:hypothetical protein
MRHIAILLDETGSMAGQETRVVTGIREYITGLREEMGTKKCRIMLKLFDSLRYRTYFSGKLAAFPELTLDDYAPGAMTPLYDSIARLIAEVPAKPKDQVFFIIDTDGLENASKETSKEMLYDLMEQKKRQGWAFLFLGADFAQFGGTFTATQSMGLNIGQGQTVDMANRARGATYAAVSKTTTKFFSGDVPASTVGADTTEELMKNE